MNQLHDSATDPMGECECEEVALALEAQSDDLRAALAAVERRLFDHLGDVERRLLDHFDSHYGPPRPEPD